MMLGFDPSATPPLGGPRNPNANPFAGFPGMEGMGMPGMEGMGGPPGAEDPMMKMLQQMMGGAMPEGGPGGMPAFPGMPGQPITTADPSAYVWRIVHALFALSLGLYIAFTTPFTGTRLERETSALGYTPSSNVLTPSSVHFFYLFATAEVILQSSRFYLEKGRGEQSGWVGMVMGFLPEPWKGYLAWVMRYSRIWTTVSGDAMVLVFVLGVCAWLRGGA
jgi:GET complex subunit GET2